MSFLLLNRRLAQQDLKIKRVYFNKTFEERPPNFYQINFISAEGNGIVILVVYALSSDKSTTTYIRMLKIIEEIQPEFKPDISNSDFKPAMLKAVHKI